MSDMADAASSGVVADAQGRSDLTAGALLRQAREAAGLHIAALAVSLKVPVKKIEALEAQEAMGRWQVLGEGGGRWGAVKAGQ